MRSVLLCSVFAFVIAAVPAEAQFMRRADDPSPVVTPSKAPPAPKKRARAAKKPATDAAPATAAAPSTAAPSTGASRRDLADCLQEADTERQIAGCTHLIEDAKQTPKVRGAAYYNRGNARAAKSEYDAAIADYDEAIKLSPKEARVYNNRGTVYRDKGDAERAAADFAEAIKLNPRYADPHFHLGNTHAAKGEADQAIVAYSAAIKADPRNAPAYVARGIAQLYAGALPKAQADLRMALRLAPTNAYAVLWHDIVEQRAKRPSAVKNTSRRVDMKAWPAPVVRLWRGELAPGLLLAAANNPSATTKLAQECEANFYGGEFALLKGTKEEAAKLFQAAAKDCPQPFLERVAANAELKALGVTP